MSGRWVILVGVACVSLQGGCAARFRAPPQPAAEYPTTAGMPAVWTLPAPRYGSWAYERRDLMQEGPAEDALYRRVTRPGRIMEGDLIGIPFLPLEAYLRRPEMTPARMNALPKAPLRRAYAALIIELDSPMPLYPLEIRPREPILEVSNLGCFDRNGHRIEYGSIEREVIAEGREDVLCPAGRFPGCIRLRLDLRFRFPWGPSVDVTEYLWLAEGFGEVQRVEHITGWIWLFWIESAYQYSLVSFEPAPTTGPTTQPAEELLNWSRMAVTFDRVFPRPRMSGLYVELVGE
ncbi:MAG: hypothetical protein ACPMAQ_00690 [Phycisphaerae bacterium]